MEALGKKLQEARLAKNISLEEAARVTKIRPVRIQELEAEDFGWVTERLAELAATHCRGRLVSTLEGGYDLGALAECSAAHVAALMAAKR